MKKIDQYNRLYLLFNLSYHDICLMLSLPSEIFTERFFCYLPFSSVLEFLTINKQLRNKLLDKIKINKHMIVQQEMLTHWYYPNLTHITTHFRYLPQYVEKLIFDDHFDLPLGPLPHSITHLTFGYIFNQSIKGILPPSLKELTFGTGFNKPIKEEISVSHKHVLSYIPSTVTRLMFGESFNQDIRGAIPPTVTHLAFMGSFDQNIHNKIPSLVTTLILPCNSPYYIENIESILPNSIKEFILGTYIYEKNADGLFYLAPDRHFSDYRYRSRHISPYPNHYGTGVQ